MWEITFGTNFEYNILESLQYNVGLAKGLTNAVENWKFVWPNVSIPVTKKGNGITGHSLGLQMWCFAIPLIELHRKECQCSRLIKKVCHIATQPIRIETIPDVNHWICTIWIHDPVFESQTSTMHGPKWGKYTITWNVKTAINKDPKPRYTSPP